MKRSSANNLFYVYEWKYIPIGYITQSKTNQECAQKSLKDLKNLHSELSNKKLYLALAHKDLVKTIEKNPNLRVRFLAVPLHFFERDISTHNKKLFDSCRKCERNCPLYRLLSKKSPIMVLSGVMSIVKVNR